ncbi:hypothetical protein B0T10DRAFT_157169 [Thelonectria olida]|uniref:DNA/RNA-binding domain-containing protein n=1 Tax=Thelonectria olida TaxID=1576542 RepID=A0A9P8VV93_9HYPO|nr:hypothetical protein B0T10DRAFT_157169 [Thelonectria olida]
MNLKKITTCCRRLLRLLLCLPGSPKVPSFSQHQPVNDLEKNSHIPADENDGKCGVQKDLVVVDDNESVSTLPVYAEESRPPPYSAGQCDAFHDQRDAPIQPTNGQPKQPGMNASIHGDVSLFDNAKPSETAISSPNDADKLAPTCPERNVVIVQRMTLQPNTRPISQVQLVAEVEGMYAKWDPPERVEEAFNNLQPARKINAEPQATDRPRKRRADEPGEADLNTPYSSPSVDQPEVSSPNSNIKSRARNFSGRRLWTEEQDATRLKEPIGLSELTDRNTGTKMMLQPETRPISQDQLVAEVKGIYAGLVIVETKSIEVDNAQASNTDTSKLNNEQWQALIALHRTLLHEYHDFFLASQHPSASPPLRRLASKYAMPARMWRHGIHSFLELLRHRLPESREHMLTFLYLAYSVMTLLYQTVPAFEDTWIECLGDLARYRMAIEDDDIQDREVWTEVSRSWYSKASDKSPATGRLYHHLAVLARPNALQQLYYYTKSLCVPTPFLSARESIMTLFDPVLGSNTSRHSQIDAAFVRVHSILFSGKAKERLQESMEEFLELLDGHISRATKGWREAGYFIGISLACSLLGYGDGSSALMNAVSQKPGQTDVPMEGSSISEALPSETFGQALSFAVRIYDIVIRRWSDINILPFAHTTLVFLHFMTSNPTAMSYLEGQYPWKLTSILLNSLLDASRTEPRMDGNFPLPEKDEPPRPLPEDYAMRGLVYADGYFPHGWFVDEKVDESKRYFELSSMVEERKDRILYLGYQIAVQQKWLTFDEATRRFSVVKRYDVDVEELPLDAIELQHSP